MTEATGSQNPSSQQESKPWERGADFNDYLKSNVVTRTVADGGTTQIDKQSNALGDLAVRIIKTQFPEYVDHINTKVTANPAEDGALASYGGARGDTISAGKINGGWSESTTIKGKGTGKTWTGQDGYLTTDQVIEGTGSIMHELYHARINAVGDFKQGLGDNWKDMLKDAQAAKFPSVGGALFGGDNLNEFLATSVTVKAMQQHDITPTGRYAGIPAALSQMEKKYPWLGGYIKAYSNPEAIKGQQKNLPSSFLDKVFGSTKKIEDTPSGAPWERTWNDVKNGLATVGEAMSDTFVPKTPPGMPSPWERMWGTDKVPEKPRTVPPKKSAVPDNWDEINKQYAQGKTERDKSQLAILQSELARETNPKNIAALKREIARVGKTNG